MLELLLVLQQHLPRSLINQVGVGNCNISVVHLRLLRLWEHRDRGQVLKSACRWLWLEVRLSRRLIRIEHVSGSLQNLEWVAACCSDIELFTVLMSEGVCCGAVIREPRSPKRVGDCFSGRSVHGLKLAEGIGVVSLKLHYVARRSVEVTGPKRVAILQRRSALSACLLRQEGISCRIDRQLWLDLLHLL